MAVELTAFNTPQKVLLRFLSSTHRVKLQDGVIVQVIRCVKQLHKQTSWQGPGNTYLYQE